MRKAFIIDDHADTAEAFCLLLKSAGYEAESFSNFDQALEGIVPDHPCILFMDYHVDSSAVTPTEFIAKVKSHHPGLKIVVISGDPRVKKTVEPLGADFMLKPIDFEKFEEFCAKYCPEN